MKHSTTLKLLTLLLAMASCVISACVKSFDGEVDDPSFNRSFQPYSFNVRTSVDTAKFNWTSPVLSAGKKYSYTVDVSQDSLFSKIEFSKTVDTLGFFVLEPTLAVAKRYFARMRVNGFKEAQPSAYSTAAFTIGGQNFLRVLREFEITPNSALIHWYANTNTTGVNKILLSVNGATVNTFDVSGGENAAGEKRLTGLLPETRYQLQLLAGAKSKGILSFITPKTISFTRVLNPTDNLAAAIDAAIDGDVIGLNPGNYNLTSIYTMTGKSVTIASTSNNPADTKIKVREINVLGNNGGLTLIGLDIDGNYSGTSLGTQFLVIKGSPNGGDPANFADVRIDNCYIHDYTRCLLIANNATAVNTQTIKSFSINNSIIYNIDKAGTSTYYTFSMEKLLFNTFTISKSTFYNMGTGLVNMGTALAASTIVPAITIEACTFNNFGSGNKYLFIDANTNKIVLNIRNSILGNSPMPGGTIQGTAYRASATGNVLNFLNNNYFNLYSTSTGTPAPLGLTGLNQVAFNTINLGWNANSTNFSLQSQPANSKIFTMSSGGGSVGDPRWAY